MPFQRGHPKIAGRKKGQTNKLQMEARVHLQELDCDPLKGMVLIAMDKTASLELRGRMFAELAKYVWPQRKAVEHTGTGGGPIELSGSSLLTDIDATLESIARRADGGTPASNPPINPGTPS